MTRRGWTALIVVTAAGLAVHLHGAEPPISREQAERLFATDVLPLLKSKCFACHGDDAKDLRGGLDLRTREAMLAGGDSGEPALVPDDPAKSWLVRAAAWDGMKMPPKANDRLTAEQVAAFRKWVAAGAPWPDAAAVAKLRESHWAAASADAVTVKTSGGLSEEWTNRRYSPADLWAYQPVRPYPVPVLSTQYSVLSNPVDAFLAHKLAEKKLQAAGEADRRTLVRRVTFDLTGLPPTPEQVAAFLADDRPDAYEQLVDRLLASPSYAEQQARHWLDVARYADSNGFSNDYERPHAWRYRDYVVRSFAADKPFDRFALEQLAGDELEPDNPEMMIAVGFLRCGPWEHTGMSVASITRQQYLDDVTNGVGETFLAAPLTCCRCHDHKFDPLPTRDYYSVQAVFAPVQFADRDVPFLAEENTAGLEGQRKRFDALQKTVSADVTSALPADTPKAQKDEADLAIKKLRQKRTEHFKREQEYPKPLAMSVYDGPFVERRVNIAYHPLPKNRSGPAPDVFILTGGALEAPAAKVGPGVLSAVAGPAVSIPESSESRRLTFARWVASADNPLTARVFVNRIWQQHFGKGIAGNPNNFGKMGKKPTHPELLDWLATWFVDHDWSVKELHRLLVTSAAYRRAGDPPDAAAAEKVDPENALLSWYPPRRLAAEELRDAQLAVSGELNPLPGGLPARPELNPEVALQPRHVMGSIAPAYQPDRTPAERHRRTLYTLRVRTLRDPGLEVFDRPTPDLSCERRAESTVTPQVFSLFNGQASHDRALALAKRVEREAGTPPERIDRAFQLVFDRPPTAAERDKALAHVARMTEHHRRHEAKPESLPTSAIRELVEEQTGTKIYWHERLDVYEHFVSDAKPWDVSAQTRALADLCLVLMNANEFVYVY